MLVEVEGLMKKILPEAADTFFKQHIDSLSVFFYFDCKLLLSPLGLEGLLVIFLGFSAVSE